MSIILHVDSDYDSRAIVRSALSFDGYRILDVAEVEEALAHLSSHDVRLIIGELYVRSRDGDVLLPTLRRSARTTDLRIIIVSTRAFEDSRQKALTNGADAFLTKPCDLRTIRETVRQVIGPPRPEPAGSGGAPRGG